MFTLPFYWYFCGRFIAKYLFFCRSIIAKHEFSAEVWRKLEQSNIRYFGVANNRFGVAKTFVFMLKRVGGGLKERDGGGVAGRGF